LKSGDVLKLYLTKKGSKIKIPIIFEDESIIVIDKKAGITVHPAPGENDFTVSELLKGKLRFTDSNPRNGVVHRLDKGTSGVMVVAKDRIAEEDLKRQFKDRKVKKTYYALVRGNLKPAKGTIDMPLGRDKINPKKMGVSIKGRNAKTRYTVLKDLNGWSFLELIPETGRTHQIRVHLAAIGFPIVGDKKYGQKTLTADRIFLHAGRIEFTHPVDKKKMSFDSKLPKDLKEIIDNLN
jgi:23S rRNA pseudouridine1911/1915/1917 synthase